MGGAVVAEYCRSKCCRLNMYLSCNCAVFYMLCVFYKKSFV